jgi:hypothetical protein
VVLAGGGGAFALGAAASTHEKLPVIDAGLGDTRYVESVELLVRPLQEVVPLFCPSRVHL